MVMRLPNLLNNIARLGGLAQDSAEVRLQKTLLVLSAFMMATLGVAWGVVYWLAGEAGAGAIPLIYSGLSFSSLLYFGSTKRYRFFRASQLLLSLLLPFFLMLALGGFHPSSAVILWSLTSPLGALVFAERQMAWRWLAGFLVLVLAGALLEPLVTRENALPDGLITAFYMLNIGFTAVVIFTLLNHAVRQRDVTLERLNLEEAKSRRLLLNILPEDIADQLKEGESTVARQHPEASILFADIVNFTPMSARLAAADLVDLLNGIFSHLDALADRYGVEKIKTIGDCYMVAAGVPREQPDHAHRLADMALEIRDYFAENRFNGHCFSVRMGMHSGPVVAGVIGHRKFAYDLWGDTVNTASRMESQGQPGEIRITRATYDLISAAFNCTAQGMVDVKGKGPMEVWRIDGRKTREASALT
jgi:guanylate cyclase